MAILIGTAPNQVPTNGDLSTLAFTEVVPVGKGGTGATSLSGVTVGSASNLASGSAGTVPYQSASGTTAMLAAGTAGQVLTSAGAAAPGWSNLPSGSEVIRVARTSDTALAGSNRGNLIDITSGTFTQTFVAAATLGSGWFCYIRNAGTGDITIDPSGSETIDGLTSYVMYPGEARLVQCNGTAFNTLVLSPFYRSFITSGTFTKPPGYLSFNVTLLGGGGGAGRNTQSCGGGAGGSYMQSLILSSVLGATATVTVGAGGTGMTGSSGNGTSGGSSTFAGNTATGGAGSIDIGGDGNGTAGGSISPYSTSTLQEGFTYQGGKAGTNAPDLANPTRIAGFSHYGGGGGGGACAGAGSGFANWGGASFYGGGGGGGGQRASTTNPNGYGGVSKWSGSGGQGGTDSVAGTNGAIPGGGGGGAGINQNGGSGGRGEVSIIGVA